MPRRPRPTPRSPAEVSALRSACKGETPAAETAGARTAPTVTSTAPTTTASAAPTGTPGAERSCPAELADHRGGVTGAERQQDARRTGGQSHHRPLDGEGPHELAAVGPDGTQQSQLPQPLGEDDAERRRRDEGRSDHGDGEEHRDDAEEVHVLLHRVVRLLGPHGSAGGDLDVGAVVVEHLGEPLGQRMC